MTMPRQTRGRPGCFCAAWDGGYELAPSAAEGTFGWDGWPDAPRCRHLDAVMGGGGHGFGATSSQTRGSQGGTRSSFSLLCNYYGNPDTHRRGQGRNAQLSSITRSPSSPATSPLRGSGARQASLAQPVRASTSEMRADITYKASQTRRARSVDRPLHTRCLPSLTSACGFCCRQGHDRIFLEAKLCEHMRSSAQSCQSGKGFHEHVWWSVRPPACISKLSTTSSV
jgi:hypothetical protein